MSEDKGMEMYVNGDAAQDEWLHSVAPQNVPAGPVASWCAEDSCPTLLGAR